MRTLIRIICCASCLFVGYVATMAWVNVNEGKDAFAGTPLEGKVDSEFAKKAVDFTSEQVEKLKKEPAVQSSTSQSPEEQKLKTKVANEQELVHIGTPEPQVEKKPTETLPSEEVKLVQRQEAKPTTEDALERLWDTDKAKSKSNASAGNTSSPSNNADASLMNSLERLMN